MAMFGRWSDVLSDVLDDDERAMVEDLDQLVASGKLHPVTRL